MQLGYVYEISTWERDDEWTYEKGDRFKVVNYDTDFGVFVGEHGRYRLFVTNIPEGFRNDYRILYIEDNLWLQETDSVANIPLLDKLIRYINSKQFEHPVMFENETTYVLVPEADVINFSEHRHASIGRNIQEAREKHHTMRKKRKAGKKISDWMTILPPLKEIGFSGGPLYKRAAASFKSAFKGGKRTRKNR